MFEKLKKLAKELGVPIKKIGDLDEETRNFLEEYSRQYEEALKKAKKGLTEPFTNYSGQCPKCGSRDYFPLFGGVCDKICAECKTAYDCMALEKYLERLRKER